MAQNPICEYTFHRERLRRSAHTAMRPARKSGDIPMARGDADLTEGWLLHRRELQSSLQHHCSSARCGLVLPRAFTNPKRFSSLA
jgi:hypothetical protein